MMFHGSSLADEVAAEIELGLPIAAKNAADRLKALGETAKKLGDLGLARSIKEPPVVINDLSVAGVSTTNITIPAFGGLLYGVSSIAQVMRLSGSDILESWDIARVKMGDIDFYGKQERLTWQQLALTFDVLEALIEEKKSQIILMDLPLFISRREEAVIADDSSVQDEWDMLVSRINEFWEKHLQKVFPFNPEGIMIGSLRSHSATSLFSALKKNPESSPDDSGIKLSNYIVDHWSQCQQLGQSRLLAQVLKPSSRSIAYSYEDLDMDPRWQPSALHDVGILGMFVRARQRSEIWHLQVPGHKSQWSSLSLDKFVYFIVQATLYDDKNALPLPLWFARKNVKFPKELLLAYREGIEKELGQHDE
jgi:hypothetical protein